MCSKLAVALLALLLIGGASADGIINPSANTPNVGNATGTLPVAHGGTGDTGTSWTAYTPTLSCTSGTLTTAPATGRFKTLGKTVFVEVSATISLPGTCAGVLLVSLPLTSAAFNYAATGFDAGSGAVLSAAIVGGTDATHAHMFTATAGCPCTSGVDPVLTGTYEAP